MEKSDKQNEEYESFLSDDCLQDFLRMAKRNPPATKDDNLEMFIEYKKGNLAMRDMIAEKNILLVVSLVNQVRKNLSSEEKLEYMQSGFIGLMEAIDRYDLSRGTTFSTHAEYWIQMRINRYRYDNERLIRRPSYMEEVLGRYKRLVYRCEKEGKPLPPRDEICSIIRASEETLKRIEEDYKLDATSLDAPIKLDKGDDGDYKDILGEESKSFNDILDKIVIEEILKTFKMTLSDYEYYILYYRVINSKKKTLEEISEHIYVTRERIRQIEEKIIGKISRMFDSDQSLKRKYIDDVKKEYPFEQINVAPCPIENYTLFFFLRDNFKEKDQIILKEKLLGKLFFNSEGIAKEINESASYVENMSKSIDSLIKEATNNVRYHMFHEKLLNKYKGQLYSMNLDVDLSDYFDFKRDIKDYWQDKSVDEILNLADANNISYDDNTIERIKSFCGYFPKKEVAFNKNHLERDVNYCLFGFANHEIPHSKLYPVFLENKDKFTQKQIDYLNIYVFKKVKANAKDNSFYKYYGDSVINKLLLYYNIEDYKKDNFTYEKYMSIRPKCLKSIDNRGIKLLDLYYGINGNSMNTREMAEFLQEDELTVENDFRRVKNKAISIYLGTAQYSYEDDREIYASVLEDEDFTLGNPHLDVAKMFFLSKKSYEEIANCYEVEPKFTPRKVAELVKYACSAMDYYRFGITSTKKVYSKEFLLSVLEKSKYDEETKDIMRTYVETKSASLTAAIHHKDLNYIHNTARKLNILANKTAIEQVKITVEDVESSVMEHESTNVLSERERIMLSMVYGLENKYNPSGKKRHPVDIAEMFGIERNITSLIRKAKEHVAAHKIGLLKTARDFIDRSELESALRDPRLPLSKEDKNIIINAYGLYDTEYLTTQEISQNIDVKEPIVRKRLYNGIITIKKYLGKELEGEVLFRIDVKPYLKYFILEDREILTRLYRDKWGYSKIEKKYKLSHHQLSLLIQKMRMHLSDLRSNLACGIDFDYFWSNALESDIPYYGNKELAVELCFLYYEKRISQSEIVKYHHPELGETTVNELIKAFTAAVIKHQNGIRKINDFSYEEIASYYEAHKDEMGVVSTKIYRNYFAKVKKNGPISKIRPNKDITYDLIREKYHDYFQVEKATPKDVSNILGEVGHTLSKDTIETLKSQFGVTHANLLNSQEGDDIINFLGPIQLIIEKNKRIEEKNINAEDNKASNNSEKKKKLDGYSITE